MTYIVQGAQLLGEGSEVFCKLGIGIFLHCQLCLTACAREGQLEHAYSR